MPNEWLVIYGALAVFFVASLVLERWLRRTPSDRSRWLAPDSWRFKGRAFDPRRKDNHKWQ